MAQTGKIALITGGNKGLGLETARQLGAKGVTVIIGARDKAKGEAAAAERYMRAHLRSGREAIAHVQHDAVANPFS